MNKQRLTKGEKRQFDWQSLVDDLIVNCEQYHQFYYLKNNFTGPSHHFHIRALTASDSEKAEMAYALLVSWGMHRMGGGAQMNNFDVFQKSIAGVLADIKKLNSKHLENISEEEFNQLEQIFTSLNPMKSSRKIVAISKILAHYLPNLVAPIDNEYTFRFICQEANPPRNWEEFELFKEIHLNLYKKVAINSTFNSFASKWLGSKEFAWDTSIPKIIDNLIIGKIGQLKQIETSKKKAMKNPA